MIDGCDDYVNVLSTRHSIARKPHKCFECYRIIDSGELYLTENGLFDGEFVKYVTCPQCLIVRHWLKKECGGFLYEGIGEDLEQHMQEYSINSTIRFALGRLVIGMRSKWENRKMPKLPLTSHDLSTTKEAP